MRSQQKRTLTVIFACVIIYITIRDMSSSTTTKCFNDILSQDIDEMTGREMIHYIYLSNSSSCRIIHDYGGKLAKFLNGFGEIVNFQSIDGQKSVCMEPDLVPKLKNCVIYSVGVSDDWTFDDAMAKFGCQIYAFDPSLNKSSYDRTPQIHFYNIGIGAEDVERDPATGWKLLTLQSIHRMLQPLHGDVPIDYLKMDIESAEWKVLPQIVRSGMLSKVKQLALEIHFVDEMPTADLKKLLKVLKSLEEAGMIRFASRPNILGDGILENRDSFLYFELAWYNSKFSSKFQ
jgi:Methyltransferase domain